LRNCGKKAQQQETFKGNSFPCLLEKGEKRDEKRKTGQHYFHPGKKK